MIENRTYFDQLKDKLKSNKWMAIVLLVFTCLIGAGAAIDAVDKLSRLLPTFTLVSPSVTEVKPLLSEGGVTVYHREANVAAKLEVDENFIDNKVKLWVSYPPDPHIPFDENAFMAVQIQEAHMFRLGKVEAVSLGNVGRFQFYITEPRFNVQHRNLSSVNVRILWLDKLDL